MVGLGTGLVGSGFPGEEVLPGCVTGGGEAFNWGLPGSETLGQARVNIAAVPLATAACRRHQTRPAASDTGRPRRML